MKLILPKLGPSFWDLGLVCRNWDDEVETKRKVCLGGIGKRTYITSRH